MRATFGGTAADFVATPNAAGLLQLAPATLTAWDAPTGGTQILDLLVDDQPATTIPVNVDGQVPPFQGPDGVLELWVSAGGDRVRVTPNPTAIRSGLTGGGGGGPLDDGAVTTAKLADNAVTSAKVSQPIRDSLAAADTATQPADLADVATSGAYGDLDGRPTIPSTAADVGALPDTYTPPAPSWGSVTGKPSTFTPSAHDHPVSDIDATGTADDTTFLRGDGTWTTPPSGGGGGVTDHGSLTGLGGDDHTLYALADGTRGDFAASGHGHAIADTTGLQAALDAKMAATATAIVKVVDTLPPSGTDPVDTVYVVRPA